MGPKSWISNYCIFCTFSTNRLHSSICINRLFLMLLLRFEQHFYRKIPTKFLLPFRRIFAEVPWQRPSRKERRYPDVRKKKALTRLKKAVFFKMEEDYHVQDFLGPKSWWIYAPPPELFFVKKMSNARRHNTPKKCNDNDPPHNLIVRLHPTLA